MSAGARISRLDRYLFRETAVPFALAFCFTVVMVFLFQSQRLLGAALGLGLTAIDLLVIFFAALPPLLVLIIPLAVLLAVMIGMSRLAMDRELIAFGAAGTAPSRLARAPVVLGALVSLAALPVAHFAEPRGLAMLRERLLDVGLRNASRAIRPGTFNEDFTGLAFYAGSSQRGGALEDMLLYDERDPTQPILIVAETGRLLPQSGKSLLLELTHGEMHFGVGRERDRYERAQFDRARLGIDAEREIGSRMRFVSEISMMSSAELRAVAASEPPWSSYGRRVEKVYWRRFALPLMAVVFALLGAAVAAYFGPKSRTKSALTALGAMVGYYLLMRIGDYAVIKAQHTVLAAAFGPNLVLLAVALGILVRAGRPR